MNSIFKIAAIVSATSICASLPFAQEIPARAGTIAAENSGALAAPKKEVDKVDIAKKLANPIANMISVPLQYQFSRGVGKNQGGSEQTLLFQPVAPFDLGGGDTFIVRPIVAGDSFKCSSTIESYKVSSGNEIVSVRSDLHSNNELVVSTWSTLVVRA